MVRPRTNEPRASRWKFLAVYPYTERCNPQEEQQREGDERYAGATAATDRTHRKPAGRARASDAPDEQHSGSRASRAYNILAAAEGLNNEQIAQRLGINRETARLWRGNWLASAERLVSAEGAGEEKALRECIEEDVLADAKRSGAPVTFTPEQVCRIVALACEDPREDSGRPITHWSSAELADEAIERGIVQSISARSVGRFLGRGGSEAASDTLLAKQRAGQRA